MTIIDASSKLFNWFCEHDSINLDDPDQCEKIGAKDNESFAAFQIALLNFEKLEIVKSYAGLKNGSVIHVLEKDLKNFQQNVTLGGGVAQKVSEKINSFCDKINDRTDYSDPLNISEKDILNLTFIIDFLYGEGVENKGKNKKSGNVFIDGDDNIELN